MSDRRDSPLSDGAADGNKIRVAIVGGGIGGLCLAAGLIKQPHVTVHVYESVPEYKDIGAGLALHMNAIKAMDLIGPQVKKAYFDRALTIASEADEEISTTVMLASGPDKGAVVAELGKAKGRKTISRSDLLAGLVELIPSTNLTFDKRLQGIAEFEDGSITLTFKDGSTAEADCVVGCDGVHSVTRAYLLGADHPATAPKNHDGWQVYRTLISAEEARKHIADKWTRTVPIMCGPRGHINCMPLHRGRDVSAGVAIRGARKPGMEWTPELRIEDFDEYTQDAKDIVKMVARDTSASWAVMDHDHAPTYARRRVCIMGDAAHAAMPFAGNGAAQAIEDAAVLNALFAELKTNINTDFGLDPAVTLDTGKRKSMACVDAAFKAYDEVRRPRSQKVVEIARDFGRLYAFAMPGYGSNPQKMKGFFKDAAAYTNNADVAGQNEEAVKVLKGLLEGAA